MDKLFQQMWDKPMTYKVCTLSLINRCEINIPTEK